MGFLEFDGDKVVLFLFADGDGDGDGDGCNVVVFFFADGDDGDDVWKGIGWYTGEVMFVRFIDLV